MTREFDAGILNGIPQHVAADYFLHIKKAGWADAPDETGVLEGQFAAPVEQVIASISEVAAAKFKLMVAYHIYAESMRGLAQHPIGEVFHEHAEMERAAAEAYLKRAAVLGSGPVHLPEIETPPASSDPIGIIMVLARAEQEAIAAQTELRQMVGELNPLGFQIEQFMIEDQHHLDELWQMLPQDLAHSPVIEQGPASGEALPSEGAEVPVAAPVDSKPVAKEASGLMSFRRNFTASAPAAAEQAGESVWDTVRGAIHGGTSSMAGGAALGGGVGAGAGALLGSGVAALPAEAKQKMMEESGPVGRFKIRHPILTGIAEGGAIGAAGGAGANQAHELLHATRGNPTGRQIAGLAPLVLGASVVPGAVSAVDKHLHDKELQELAKDASAAAHLKSLGAKMRAGVSRYGELLTGSKAKDLAREAGFHHDMSKLVARSGVDNASRLSPEAKREFAQNFKALRGKAIATGDSAVRESVKSRTTQVGTAAAGVGGVAVAAGAKHKKDMGKIDRTNERLKKAMVDAFLKLGFAPPEPGLGTDPGSAPQADAQQAVVPQPSMAAPGVQPPMANPAGQAQYAPVNYLEAEETAQRAQEQNEAAFYRGQAQNATMQAQSMGTQVADIQGQLDQLSAQAAESQNQVMAANEEAVRANDNMLNQATLAARMRMGMQQLRAQMMEIASQDPEQLAAAAGGPTPMDVGNQASMSQSAPGAAPGGDPAAAGGAPPGAPADPSAEPGAQPGTPGASPDPGAPPGSPPGGAGGPSGSGSADEPKKSDGESPPAKKDTGGETTVSIKKGSVKTASIYAETMGKLPFAAAGGAIGAGAGYLSAKRGADIPNLRERVDALKGQQDGGFGKSIELAQAQMSLGHAEEAKMNPGRSALRGGLLGAGIGAALSTAVPAGISEGKRLVKNLGTMAAARQGL